MYIFLFRHFEIIFSNTPPRVPCLILIVFLLVPHPSPARPLILICKLANIQFTEHFVSLSTNCCCQTAKLILIQHQTFKQRVPNIWNVSLGLPENSIIKTLRNLNVSKFLKKFKPKSIPTKSLVPSLET